MVARCRSMMMSLTIHTGAAGAAVVVPEWICPCHEGPSFCSLPVPLSRCCSNFRKHTHAVRSFLLTFACGSSALSHALGGRLCWPALYREYNDPGEGLALRLAMWLRAVRVPITCVSYLPLHGRWLGRLPDYCGRSRIGDPVQH